MSTLLFFATVIVVLVLIVGVITNAIQKRSMIKKLWLLGGAVVMYAILWMICYFVSSEKPVPFNTDVCFDDLCATVEGADTLETLGIGPNDKRYNFGYVLG
jgi:hypothetical protein